MQKITLAAIVLASTALAAIAQQPKPEDELKLRKAAYALTGYNFASLSAMAQDKKPYNKDEAIRNADFVALLSTVPKSFFGEETQKLADSKAKPDIWANKADFDKKMEKMNAETAKLPQVARTGDLAALKKQVADTGASCKACHDDYRAK
jgi:cytochrome c556